MPESALVIDPDVIELLRDFQDATSDGLRGREASALSTAILGGGRLPRPASALLRALENAFEPAIRTELSRVLNQVSLEMLRNSSESAGRVLFDAPPEHLTRGPGLRAPHSAAFGQALAERGWVAAKFGEDATILTEILSIGLTPTAKTAADLAQRALRLASMTQPATRWHSPIA